MAWSALLLALKVAFSLIPQILGMIEEEKEKQAGRDEIVLNVLKRFRNVSDRAENARDAARDNIAGGVSDDEFRRD